MPLKWLSKEEGEIIVVHSLNKNWQEVGKNTPFANFVGTQKGVTWNCSSDNQTFKLE